MLSFRKSIYLCWWFSHWNHSPLWKCAWVLNACVWSISRGEGVPFQVLLIWLCFFLWTSFFHLTVWWWKYHKPSSLYFIPQKYKRGHRKLVGRKEKKKEEEEKSWRLFFEVQACFDCVFWGGEAKISSNKQKYREKNSLSSTTSLQIFTLSIFQRDDNAHLPVYQITEVLTTLLESFLSRLIWLQMFCRTFVFKHSHKKRILLSLGVLIMNSFNFLVLRIKCTGFLFHTVVSTCDLILSVVIHHPYIAAIYKYSLRSLYFKLM